jgi:hypothetical protein
MMKSWQRQEHPWSVQSWSGDDAPPSFSHAWTWREAYLRSPCFQQATAHQASSHPSNHHPRPRGHEQRPSRQIEESQGNQSMQGRGDHDVEAVSQPSSSNGRPQQWRE